MTKLYIVYALILLPMFAVAETPTDLLKKLVEISSDSKDVSGVNKVQKIFSERLQSLGFKIEFIPNPSSNSGSLLVGTLAGQSSEFITFVVHADTVFEKSSGFSGFRVSEDKKKAFGPGVIDDKGGMVVLFSALSDYLKNNPTPKKSLRVVSSPAEEVGAPEFLPLFQDYSRNSVLVLGLEPCLDEGAIIDSRRGNRWYHIKVVGREAHAGRAHQEGVNACWELAKKLEALAKLTDYSKDLTVNIGRIEGGKDKYNIVCGEASAKIDVRFSSLEARDATHKRIEKIVNTNSVAAVSDQHKVTSSFEVVDDTAPFSPSSAAAVKIELLKKLIGKHEGRKVTAQKSGGVADTNNFSRPGLAIIDGLGACGGKMHTPEEYIDLESLETRAKVLSEFLSQQ